MYTNENFATKKQLKEALASGRIIGTYQPGPFPAKTEGWVALEGPHYPKAHTWYAEAFLVNGNVTKVR